MAKLIDLFTERESELYDYVKYPYKEDDDTQPYRYTTLDNAEPMNNTFFEDQSNPVSLSARRDFNRMFQFSKSAQGFVFLGKQQFLQTGNTFAQTRLYNPLNIQIHSVPFVHKSRHLNVKQTIDSILGQENNYGTLQLETIDEYKTKGETRAKQKGGLLTLSPKEKIKFGSAIRGLISNTISDTIDSFVNSIRSGFNAQFNSPVETDWNLSRPELRIGNGVGFYEYLRLNSDESKNLNQDQLPYNKPDPATGILYADQVQNYLAKTRGDGKRIPIASPGIPKDGKFVANSRYYKNFAQSDLESIFRHSLKLKDNNSYDVDTVDVIFKVLGQTRSVRFTALIEDINETVTPTYNENKYIGRYETFYTYNKVVRDLSFKLTLQAFSHSELDHIIEKMSYLTSLAYPTTTENYLTPNIMQFTLGKIYYKYNCILQSLTHNIENDVSWDIDEQRPTRIVANVGLRILDKEIHTPNKTSIYSNSDVTVSKSSSETIPITNDEPIREREVNIEIGEILNTYGEGFNEIPPELISPGTR